MSKTQYILLPETASTNTFAKENLQDFSRDYAVVYTLNQTAGRGMEGNHWESQGGKNISFSIICHPNMVKPSEQFIISMAIAVDIITVLQKLYPVGKDNFKVKWPNDIYWKDKKLGGILIENTLKGYRMDSCIIGIGINVNQEFFKSDAPNPVSLKHILRKETDPIELMELISDQFSQTLQVIKLLEDTDNHSLNIRYDSIRDDYHRLLYRYDNQLHAFQEGDSTFEAKIRKVQNDGRLTLIKASGEEKDYWLKEVKFTLENTREPSRNLEKT